MEHDEDIFKEIMALIDKRNRLCEEWIEYIEHVLREIMDGNNDYRSMLPNHVILPKKDTQPKAA